MTDTMPEDFASSNIALVAYLRMQGHHVNDEYMDHSTATGRDSYTWVFTNTPELADDVSLFFGGGATVDPQQYNTVIANLKRTALAAR